MGVAGGISFMLRNLMSLAIYLRTYPVSSLTSYPPLYEDVDDYAFYNFKIYQLIEAQIISGMAAIYNNIISSIKVIVFLEMVALIAALLFWLLRLEREKMQLSDLYAQVLQLPQVIFR